MAQLYSGKGAGAAAHLDLKETGTKMCASVSASTQNRHFQNDLINYLRGILS